MAFKLLLLTMLTAVGLSLSGCVVYDHGGYYRDHDNRYHQDRDYDRRHDDYRDRYQR